MLSYNDFKNCDNQYRSAPFWSWNDELDKEELIHQIHEMHKQGMGGFFMHPRGGLVDKYLGDSFMEAVKACVEEAEKLGMKAWLYDEDRFPSGVAGGLVLKDNPEYAARVVQMFKMPCDQFQKDEDTVKVYLFQDNDNITDITEMDEKEVQKSQGHVLVFKVVTRPKEPRYGNVSFADLCNKEAVDTFIKITHEAYKETVGQYFGGVIPGIFTDEPDFRPNLQKGINLPWPNNFQEQFKKQKGYDIVENLPKLFLDIGNFRKVRFDFWDVVSGLFVKNFTKNIYDWCEGNGLKLTGHFWEHAFPDPSYNGSVMPNYEFMQVPGIDILFNTEEEDVQVGNAFIVKEVSSVANQLGKERVLSETYGASGWELDFAEQKRVADWQFALGINLVCQHLVHLSLKGYRKRDFPLSFMDHQPWWDYYRLLGDYIGRLSYIMSQGEFVGDVLMLHPSSSTWAEYNGQAEKGLISEIGESAKSLAKILSEIQCPFDLGDDVIIERHGRVEGNKFVIGKMAYTTVILPAMTVMRSTSFKLLKEFAQNGGRIITAGITPSYLDGEESQELKDFFQSPLVKKVAADRESLREVLSSMGNTMVHLEELNGKGAHDIYCHVRKCGNAKLVFLCNTSRKESYKVRLKLDKHHSIEEWDAVTGNRITLTPYTCDGGSYIDLEFEPVGSHLLVMDYEEATHHDTNCDSKLSRSHRDTHKEISAQSLTVKDWKGQRTDYNALTINKCSISFENGPWEKEDNVLIIDDALKDRLGLERSNIFVRQPWMYSQEEKDKKYSLKAKYVFHVGEEIKGDIYLAAESPEIFKVFVNGKPVSSTGKTYKDRAFILHDIKDAVVVGQNEIILETHEYGQLVSLESVYVVGDFKLQKDDKGYALANEDENILPGDWTQQGYPYYSGSIKYTANVDINTGSDPHRVELQLGHFWGVVARVLVNDKEAGILGWKPYRVDITDYISHGNNTITVEVINSLQNLLGPHHYLPVEGIVTPGSFYCQEDVKFDKSGFDGNAVVKIIPCHS